MTFRPPTKTHTKVHASHFGPDTPNSYEYAFRGQGVPSGRCVQQLLRVIGPTVRIRRARKAQRTGCKALQSTRMMWGGVQQRGDATMGGAMRCTKDGRAHTWYLPILA